MKSFKEIGRAVFDSSDETLIIGNQSRRYVCATRAEAMLLRDSLFDRKNPKVVEVEIVCKFA